MRDCVNMCKVTMLREVMKERLNVAMQAIYELFETTILEYEEELRRTNVEKERKIEQLPEAILESRSFHGGLLTCFYSF